jgi:hypothetical protein
MCRKHDTTESKKSQLERKFIAQHKTNFGLQSYIWKKKGQLEQKKLWHYENVVDMQNITHTIKS